MTTLSSLGALLAQMPPSTSVSPAATTETGTSMNAMLANNSTQETQDSLSPDAVNAAVETLNQAFRQVGIFFEIDADSGRVVTHVVDRESGEQLLQIPSEEVMRLLHYVESQRQEPQSGLLLDNIA